VDFDDYENERQKEKKSYYHKKHFDHLSEEDLHKMAKLSPIAVSEDDIKLQADIDQKSDKTTHKTHRKSETDLHLQDLNTRDSHFGSDKKSHVQQISDEPQQNHRKHKHSVHKKHEAFKDIKHKTRNTKLEESYGKSSESNRKESQKSKHNRDQKHRNKKHEKKSKQDFGKKYRKYNSKYY